MSNPPYFAGLDVGGSSMKAGVVDDDGRPLASVSLPTEAERGQEFGLERIRHHVRELAFPVPAAQTQIRYAQLGVDAGFIGAARCGRQLVTG